MYRQTKPEGGPTTPTVGSLASDLALALDPVRLVEAAGIEPDPRQA